MVDSQIFLYMIILILVLSNIYLLYKTRKVEGFAVTDEMKASINEIYMADIGAIRNLSNIATAMTTNNDTLTLPATKVKISGKLEVDGDVEFLNRDNGFINNMPKYTVLSIATNTVPKGWALCNGKTYKLNSNGVAYEVVASDTTGTTTPDLRGRFILGGGAGTGLTNRVLNATGGAETHTLTIAQMPSHPHDIINILNQGLNCEGNNCGNCPTGGVCGVLNAKSGNSRDCSKCARPNEIPTMTGNNGGGQPHNNMPPFYVLIYIMKL